MRGTHIQAAITVPFFRISTL